MNDSTWKRAKQIFHEALEKPGSERSRYVAAACGEEQELRAQVQALLLAHDEAGEFLASPTLPEAGEAAVIATSLTATPPTERPGATIGHYKLLQVIGEGGFGVVYMAEQEEPVRRRVALKIIKLGMDTKQVIARFEAERQALALMEHPNIARVLDAGATETGRPYFVMELVKGIPITEYCDTNLLTTRERLDLFMEVCSAVQHAHQKGIVHRDIKPSNVLVTLHDGKPVPKVIDFGIAKATSQRLTEKTLFTEYGQFIGTPVYMSPEQAEMSGLDIDTRSDIYSLGVLLYELLTGTTPFDIESLRAAGYGEIQRIIREEEPPKPSTRLSTLGGALTDVAKQRKTDPGGLTRLVRGDLDWIVMRALEKDRTRRYASASEFAADVGRHVGDEPVVARPPTAAYKLRKYVRKHRGPVVAIAAVVVTALVLGSIAIWQGRIAQQRGVRMQQQALRVRANSILVSAEATEDPLLKALLIDEVADFPELPGRLRIAREVADHPLPLAVLRGHEGLVLSVAISPDGTRIVTGSADKTARVWRMDGTGKPIVLRGHEEGVLQVSFSPDGSKVLTASFDGTARLWPVDGIGEPIVLSGHENWVRSAEFSPDGSRVATASNDGTARVWRADGTGAPVVLRGHESPVVRRVAFSPDGSRIATAAADGTARVWRVDGTGAPIVFRHEDGGVVEVSFSPDGKRLLTVGGGLTARVWPADGVGEPIVLRHERHTKAASFSPDGGRVATGSVDGTARVWRADGSGDPVLLPGSEKAVSRVAFTRDGDRVVISYMDGTARVWNADGSGEPVVLGRHAGPVLGLAVNADGTRVVTASTDGTVRVWRSNASGETRVFPGFGALSPDGTHLATFEGGATTVWFADGSGDPVVLAGDFRAFSPDGTRLITAARDGTARVWRVDGTGEPIVLSGHKAEVWGAAFAPDGKRVVTGSLDGTARVWSADGKGEAVVLRGHDAGVPRVAFSPDGTRVVGNCMDGSVWVWRANGTGQPTILPGPESGVLRSMYFIHDVPGSGKRRILNVYWDAEARLWRNEATREPVVVPESGRGYPAMAFWSPEVALSPDGSHVIVALTGRLWRTDGTGEPVALTGEDGVYNAAFSPDGERIAGSCGDGRVLVWDADGTGEPMVLRGHTNEVYHVAFNPDGTRVVSGSFDSTARVWNADGSGGPVVLQGHDDAVFRVSFSPDGERVVTASWDGTTRIWRVTWPALLAHLRQNLHACLAPEQRMKFLAESASEARATYAACEREHGREPVFEEKS